ncbi:MAG TPA: rhodanese-like domain-containing protein [Kineosporiaceae bacterium]|nr:rhodanese-like domain-containing protein [Kineosporiaceae bacterium]
MTMAYAGDLSPAQAYQLLVDEPDCALVDVRTRAEWSYVGVPDLSGLGRPVICVEWVSFPDGARNPQFLQQLAEAGVKPESPVAFLCRSGQRSAAAAELATASGFARAYNVAEGFEGPLDGSGHRGSAGGWKAAGLPWRQS